MKAWRWRREDGGRVTYHMVGSRSGFGGCVMEFNEPSEFNGMVEWTTWRPGKMARPTRPGQTLVAAKKSVERWLNRCRRVTREPSRGERS